MFEDKRSKKVVLVAHCVLNQNAKLGRCAHYPGVIKEVAQLLLDRGVGIIQMPCPEMLYLGLDREADSSVETTVASEDTRIALRMAEPAGQTFCRNLAHDLIRQIEEYQKHGFEIIGMIGINGSPTCGVEITWFDNHDQPGPGVFVNALIKELEQKKLVLPMRGIKAYEPESALAAATDLLLDI